VLRTSRNSDGHSIAAVERLRQADYVRTLLNGRGEFQRTQVALTDPRFNAATQEEVETFFGLVRRYYPQVHAERIPSPEERDEEELPTEENIRVEVNETFVAPELPVFGIAQHIADNLGDIDGELTGSFEFHAGESPDEIAARARASLRRE